MKRRCTALRRVDSIWKHYRNETTEMLLHILYYIDIDIIMYRVITAQLLPEL